MATIGSIYKAVKKLTSIFHIQHNHYNNTCNGIKCWKWDVTPMIHQDTMAQVKYAVLILNRPIVQKANFVRAFWNNATVRVTIDGGTVRWHKFLTSQPQEVQNTLNKPDLITGDFDSVIPEVLEEYKKKGCKTVHTPNQDHTDFTKSLMELNSYCKRNGIELDHVIALAESSGRIDHTIGNIQTLFLNKDEQILDPHVRVYIMSSDAVSWLLYPGEHVINVPDDTRSNKRSWCSLIPIGEACERVTTTGLKWNLDNQSLRFGGIVSTSNAFSGEDQVTVKCSHTLLWSMKIPSLVVNDSWNRIAVAMGVHWHTWLAIIF